MKRLMYFAFLILSITSCDSEPDVTEERTHFILETLNDHLPFDQFNNSSKAIFRNTEGGEFVFNLKIEEDVANRQFADIIYSYNKINFLYLTEFNIQVPNLAISTSLEYLTDNGYTEQILCSSSLVSASVQVVDLTIVPNSDFQNTILNEEFTWMDEMFTNIYSNNLVEENSFDPVKIFYQSPNGIIGFIDNSSRSWIFDRYE